MIDSEEGLVHKLERRDLPVGDWAFKTIPFFNIRIDSPVGEAPEYQLRMTAGVNFVWRVSVHNEFWAPFDLTNWFIRMVLREKYDSEDVIETIAEGSKQIRNYGSAEVVDGVLVGGYFDIILRADETGGFNKFRGVYDIELVLIELETVEYAGDYTNAALLKNVGDGRGKITADGGTPFAGLISGDVIRIIDAANPENDHAYTVDAVGDLDTEVWVVGELGYGRGVDAATNADLIIQKLIFDDALHPGEDTGEDRTVIQLMRGRFVIKRSAAQPD